MGYSDERFKVTVLKTDPDSKHFKISRRIDGVSLDLVITNKALSIIEKSRGLDLFLEKQIDEAKIFVDSFGPCQFILGKDTYERHLWKPFNAKELKVILNNR